MQSHTPVEPMSSEQTDAMIGRVFEEKYRVESFIARGGMGAVFKGTALETDEVVALKVLTVETHDQLFRRRFFNEAAMSASLSHPNCVRVLDFGAADDGTCYIVMELLEGQPFHHYLKKRGPMAPLAALRVAADTCDVLKEAHAKGFIHRDLKPSNLYVIDEDEQGPVIKVLDFGLAKRVEQVSNLTLPGTMLGSPTYMSPEQMHGLELGLTTDLYNVGLLLFRMLTGKNAFQGKTMQAVLIAQATETVAPLATHRDDLDAEAELDWIISTCLQKHPSDRFENAAVLKNAIEVAMGVIKGDHNPVEFTLVNGSLLVSPASTRRTPNLLMVAAVAGGIGAFFAVFSLGLLGAAFFLL